jgi:hypothetical protein
MKLSFLFKKKFSQKIIKQSKEQIDKFSPLRVLHKVLETADTVIAVCIVSVSGTVVLEQFPAASNTIDYFSFFIFIKSSNPISIITSCHISEKFHSFSRVSIISTEQIYQFIPVCLLFLLIRISIIVISHQLISSSISFF